MKTPQQWQDELAGETSIESIRAIQMDAINSLQNTPWPLRDVVSKLCEAAEILLHEHDYDGHGHELISGALKVGKEWLRKDQ